MEVMKMEEINYFIKVNEKKVDILIFFEDNKINQAVVSNTLDINKTTTDAIIKDLYLMGLLDREQVKGRYLYYLTKKGKRILKQIKKS